MEFFTEFRWRDVIRIFGACIVTVCLLFQVVDVAAELSDPTTEEIGFDSGFAAEAELFPQAPETFAYVLAFHAAIALLLVIVIAWGHRWLWKSRTRPSSRGDVWLRITKWLLVTGVSVTVLYGYGTFLSEEFADVLRLTGFFAFELLAPGTWPIYLTLFLASLGAISGLDSLRRKIAPPHEEADSAVREARRQTIIMVSAILFGWVVAPRTILASKLKYFQLDMLYELEVHFVRFEGLLFNALSTTTNATVVETLMAYLRKYARRIDSLIDRAMLSVNPEELESFNDTYNRFSGNTRLLLRMGGDEIGSGEAQRAITEILQAGEILRVFLRRNIRSLEAR